MLGLAFEPVSRRTLPEIEGVLWLDRGTAHLQVLEFRYRNLPWPVESRHLGGRVQFERLPAGLWVVSHWRLRMPELVFYGRSRGWMRLGGVGVRALKETGGYLIQLREEGSALITRSDGARGGSGKAESGRRARPQVRGVVADMGTGGPIPGAVLLMTDHDGLVRDLAFASPRGWFELTAPAAGTYRLTAYSSGYRAVEPEILKLRAGLTVDVRVNMRVGRDAVSSSPAAPGGPAHDLATEAWPRGHLFSRREIEALEARSVLDVVLVAPGARLLAPPNIATLALNRRACAPQVLLDGHRLASPALLEKVDVERVERVEIYSDIADTPHELRRTGDSAAECGTVAVHSAT